MSIWQTIEQDYKQAFLQKEKDVVGTLRLVLSALKNEKINKRSDLDDSDTLKILKTEVKKRKESIEEYTKASRTDLADKEKIELEIIEKYLPKQLSEEEIRQRVKAIIADLDSDNFGQVMGKVMAQLKDEADGFLVKKIIEQELGSK